MTEKRFTYVKNNSITQYQSLPIQEIGKSKALHCQGVVDKLNKLSDENEKLKKGMIGVVDRYIKNVEYNPPSSARTYLKVKGALVNVREGLRDLLEDLE